MRILHVSDVFLPRLGGIELHIHDLATRQLAEGHDVEVLTLTRSGSVAELGAHPLVHCPPDGAGWVGKAAYVARNRGIAELYECDVVHAHISTISPLSFLSLRGAIPTPTVATVHSLWRRYRWLYRAFDAANGWSRYPIVWSTVSHAAADWIKRSAWSSLDVPVVPNGIDLANWPLVHRPYRAGEMRLASVMRLTRRKRPIPLLRVLRALRERLPDSFQLTAVIIGDGPQRSQVERFIARHGMGDWVELPGQLPRSEVARALARATHYVAPAQLESFGIAALEARTTGLPVVGLAGSGLCDFIEPGRDGALVSNDAEMVDVLARLAVEPLPAQDLIDRSRLTEMSWGNVLAATMQLYAQAGARVDERSRSRIAS